MSVALEDKGENPAIEYEIRTHDQSGYETFFLTADSVEITVDLIPMLNLYIHEPNDYRRTVGIFRNWIYCIKRNPGQSQSPPQ